MARKEQAAAPVLSDKLNGAATGTIEPAATPAPETPAETGQGAQAEAEPETKAEAKGESKPAGQASLSLDSTRKSGPGPTATAVRDYDDLVREIKDLEEMTSSRGWIKFFAPRPPATWSTSRSTACASPWSASTICVPGTRCFTASSFTRAS